MSANLKYQGRDRKEFQKLLRDNNFRSTEGRLALLSALKSSHEPLSVETLARQISSHLDEVNVYRALESFARAGIVRRVDLHHGHVHYEFTHGDDHHHIICTSCDKLEDFVGCEYDKLLNKALKQTSTFSKVTSHSFELFGLCNTCAKA
jgi:Fur family transcriptional regulator, ferric uptake regulator